MAVKSMIDSCDRVKDEFFIHIKDLPWMACRTDIRDFFHGLSVKEDGILIRHYDAFVAFEDPSDMDSALNRENRHFLDSEIHLSVISKPELRNVLFRIACRKLDFSEKDGGCKKTRNKTEVPRQKKIRPTPVTRSKKRKVEASLIFCPKESDLPPPEQSKNETYNSSYFHYGLSPCKKKKIHPIRLPDVLNVENFSVFHPENCYELKNVILGVS